MFRFRTPLNQSVRFFRTSSFVKSASKLPNGKPSILKSRFFQGIAIGMGLGITVGLIQVLIDNRHKIGLESVPEIIAKVDLQAPTKSDPFPSKIAINKVPFQAIATGVRAVTFLNFHVYAVGLYVASEDIEIVKRILNQTGQKYSIDSKPVDWQSVFKNSTQEREVVEALINGKVKFAIRICPVRNTDFNHMRDGFVRSVMNQPESKSLQSVEFGEGINEIKRSFGRKRKLTKGESITWCIEPSGGMSAWYGDLIEAKELLGGPKDADVTRLFFLQYLSGDKPNSPTLKENAVSTLLAIANADE